MIRLHNMNRTHTFIDVESGQLISLPKDETDKPPVNADVNGLMIYGKTTQDGEPTPDNPVDLVNIPPEFNLTVCGRNLLDITKAYNRNPTFSSFVIVGNSLTATLLTGSVPYVRLIIPIFLNAGNYTIKNNYTRTGLYGGDIYVHNQLDSELLYNFNIGVHTFTVNTSKIYYLWLNMTTGIAGTIDDTVTWSNLEIIKGTYTAETMPPYQPYQGSTYPYRIEDLDGNLHELCSLPDGTRDEYDRDNGILIKRVKRLTILSGTDPFNWIYADASSAADPTDTLCTAGFTDATISTNGSFVTNTNVYCDIATPGFYTPIEPYLIWLNGQSAQLKVIMTLEKSELASLDNVGLRDWITAHAPFDIYYALAEPQIIPLKKYDPISFPYNQKPKSIQYHTNIFTDVGAEMQCEVRKLGNRKMGEFYWVTENGDYIVTDDNDYIMLEY